jgi:hypothetical protein
MFEVIPLSMSHKGTPHTLTHTVITTLMHLTTDPSEKTFDTLSPDTTRILFRLLRLGIK